MNTIRKSIRLDEATEQNLEYLATELDTTEIFIIQNLINMAAEKHLRYLMGSEVDKDIESRLK